MDPGAADAPICSFLMITPPPPPSTSALPRSDPPTSDLLSKRQLWHGDFWTRVHWQRRFFWAELPPRALAEPGTLLLLVNRFK